MARRNNRLTSVQAFLEEAAATPVNWPAKQVNLEYDSLSAWRQRPMTGALSVAELYHENSKVSRGLIERCRAATVDVLQFRREFICRRARVTERSGLTAHEVSSPVRALFERARLSGSIDTYAIEVGVVERDVFATLEPEKGELRPAKRLAQAELGKLEKSVRLLVPPGAPPFSGTCIVLIGCFVRNEILFGLRGYRHTLMEAGRISQRLLDAAVQLQLPLRPIQDFADREVDALLELDGTERSAILIFELARTS